MRNLFKKSLACCLALALCLTAMVGLTVSAAEVAGTITVGEVTVEPGTAEAKVDITLSAAGLSEAILNVSTDAGTITAVTSDDVSATLATNGIKMALYTEGDSSVDSATATITVALADTQTEKEYTVNVSIATAASVDENLINAEPASGKITVKAAEPVGPVLDETIVPTVTINIQEKINARVLFSKEISNYADFELVVTRQKATQVSGVYNLTEAQDYVYGKEDAYSILADGRAMYLYNELGMYELGIDFTIMAKCYDAEGNYVAYSNPVTTNIGKLAYALYSPANASAKNKNIAIDIAKLGDEAQKYMVNGKDCGLATVTSPITYFPADATEGATFDASKLNTTNVPDSAVSGITVTPTVNLSANPALRYLVNGTGTTYAHETLTLDIDYINGKNGSDGGVVIDSTGLQVVGTAGTATVRYLNLFSGIALYDGNVPVTATLYSGETKLASVTYSVESYVAANYTNAKMGAVLKAVANLGTSARAYFNMK